MMSFYTEGKTFWSDTCAVSAHERGSFSLEPPILLTEVNSNIVVNYSSN